MTNEARIFASQCRDILKELRTTLTLPMPARYHDIARRDIEVWTAALNIAEGRPAADSCV